jgi:hypothetical protein
VAAVVWPRSAARANSKKGTRRRAGSAPESQGEWGASDGERMDREEVGRLGERRSNARPPSVRRIDVHQDAVESGRLKQDKVEILFGKARVFLGKARGEMSQSKKLI